MNPKYDIHEQIDRYLSHSLSEQELAEFTQHLERDATLRETLEAQKLAHELIVDEALIHLKERMQREMNGPDKGFSTRNIIVLTSFLALISAGLLYLFIPTPKDLSEKGKRNIAEKKSESKTENTTGTTVEPSEPQQHHKNNIPKPATTNTKENVEKQNVTEVRNDIPEEKKAPAPEEKEKTFITTNPDQDKSIPDCKTVVLEAETKLIEERLPANQQNTSVHHAYIIVDKTSTKGGDGPYSYSLDGKTFSEKNNFEINTNGIYYVFIKDRNNCSTKLKKPHVVEFPEQEEKPVVRTIDEAFTPSQGEKWAFPLGDNTDGTITIQDKTGQIVFTKNIQGGYPSEWDGLDNNGRELGAGNYVFIINFTNLQFVKGHISIYK